MYTYQLRLSHEKHPMCEGREEKRQKIEEPFGSVSVWAQRRLVDALSAEGPNNGTAAKQCSVTLSRQTHGSLLPFLCLPFPPQGFLVLPQSGQ